MAQYDYAAKAIAPAQLDDEIKAASFAAKYQGVATHEVTVGGDRTSSVYTSSDLTAGEESELDGIISAHTPA